jgi:sphingomyelin phosphodiesterase 2
LKFLHGDYYVGKGCGTALVNHPQLGLLEIFNTHLHAGYGPKDQYKAHRATECWQLANLLRCSAAMGRHIIMVTGQRSRAEELSLLKLLLVWRFQ